MNSTRSNSETTEVRTQPAPAFTPGPWVTDRTTDDRLAVRAESERFAICTFAPFVKNHEANAQLCAAGPAMHAALTEIEDTLRNAGSDADLDALAQLARAALLKAKATGA